MFETAYSINEAVGEAIRSGKVRQMWQDRLSDMMTSLCTRRVLSAGSVVTECSKVMDLNVTGQWPLQGEVLFTRVEDGQRLKLYHDGSKFKGEGVV